MITRAQAAEHGGFDEFWVIEDCFYTAGISLAATALAVTSDITVGVGIMPVVARNAAVTAGDSNTFPDRPRQITRWFGPWGAGLDAANEC